MMAASKPTSSLSMSPHFLVDVLNVDLGDLSGDQGSSLSIDGASPPPSNCRPSVWYSEFDRNHEVSPCWSLPVLYPHTHIWRRQPKSCFGENQLFPDSISFSLLTTSHPNVLYNIRVRASICLSTNFTLLMASSSGFGSYISYQPCFA